MPTYQEAGINGLVFDQWHGVFVPVGTPPAIAAGLNAEINKVVADSAVRKSFFKQGQEPIGGTAEDFAQFFRGEYACFASAISSAIELTASDGCTRNARPCAADGTRPSALDGRPCP